MQKSGFTLIIEIHILISQEKYKNNDILEQQSYWISKRQGLLTNAVKKDANDKRRQ